MEPNYVISFEVIELWVHDHWSIYINQYNDIYSNARAGG